MKHSFKTPWFLSDTFFSIFFVFIIVCMLSVFALVGIGAYNIISAGPEGIGKTIGEAVKAYKDTVK
jgi:hypothetical protein